MRNITTKLPRWDPRRKMGPGGVSLARRPRGQKPLAVTIVNIASGAACYGGPMTTIACVLAGGLSRADLLSEIQTRLKMTEAESERMLRQFRSLPVDHPDRGVLVRQLEIAAAVAGELESLLSLVGPGSARSPYALVS